MSDTLRSIAEKWRMIAGKIDDGTHTSECSKRACDFRARAAELATLLSEYEKLDLVKKWREDAKPFLDYHGIGSVILKCADELETWLAVNLERIKAEARQDGEASAYKSAIALLHSFSSHADRGEVLGILRGLQDMSEGKTRTLEEVRAALEAQAKEKP